MRPVLRHSLLALAAALVLGGAIWFMLPRSGPPSGTFALYKQAGNMLVAEAAPGFYGVERSSKHSWAWTEREGTLVLRRLAGTDTNQSVRLRFTLRAIVPRTVTVSFGEFVLWQGRIEKSHVQVDIPSFTLTGPSAAITLTSDLPGELKPGSNDVRKLAFALYDLEISETE